MAAMLLKSMDAIIEIQIDMVRISGQGNANEPTSFSTELRRG
jgi:hypothetical protein